MSTYYVVHYWCRKLLALENLFQSLWTESKSFYHTSRILHKKWKYENQEEIDQPTDRRTIKAWIIALTFNFLNMFYWFVQSPSSPKKGLKELQTDSRYWMEWMKTKLKIIDDLPDHFDICCPDFPAELTWSFGNRAYNFEQQ